MPWPVVRCAPPSDILLSGGVRYNRELLELQPGGATRRRVAAAKAEAERARLEVDRTKLALRARLATAYREDQNAVATVERHRTRIIPKAQHAYELYLNSFRGMAAAYPRVLISQRNFFQLQEDDVNAPASAWQSAIEIQGLLLTGRVELTAYVPPPGSMAVPLMRSGSGAEQN